MYAARTWMPFLKQSELFEIQKEINKAINQMEKNFFDGEKKKSVNKIRAELGIKNVKDAMYEAMCKRCLKYREKFLEEVNDSHGRQRANGFVKLKNDKLNFDRKIFNQYGGAKFFSNVNYKVNFTKKLKSISTEILEHEKKNGALPKPPDLQFFCADTQKLY